MANKGKILLVEDEEPIVHVLTSILTANDYVPICAKTGEQALVMATSHQPDAVLLDLGLPGIDGMEVLRRIRERYFGAVLVVSARDQEKQKVQALDLGADDYITKPFGSAELLARVRAALRNSRSRLASGEGTPAVYEVRDFRLDFDRRLITVGGQEVHLTQNEYKIVELLARQPGRVLTYDFIMEHVWGPYVPSDNKILRVNMANIRRKLEQNPAEPQYILTEMGVGYRFAEEDN